MMASLVLIFQFVCLSLWIGGTTVLLVIVTPSAFRSKSSDEANQLVGLILKRFSGLLAVLQVFFLATVYLQLLLLSDSAGLKLRLALSLTSLAMLLTVYYRFTVLPRIAAFHPGSPGSETSEEAGREIRGAGRSQGRSTLLLTMNLFLGLCVVIILILPF